LRNRREMKLDEMPPEAKTSAGHKRSDRRALPPQPPPPPRRPPPPPYRAFNGRPGEERSTSAPERQEEAAAADTGRGVARPRDASPKLDTSHSRLPSSHASLQVITGPQVGTPLSVRAHLARIPASILCCDCLRMVLIWCWVLVAGELAKSAGDETRRDAAGSCDGHVAPAERSLCTSSSTSAPTAPPSSSSLSCLQ
jgi:hypothetical protein